MPEYRAPMKDIQFVMNDVLDFRSHYTRYHETEEVTQELVSAILNEAAKFSQEVVAPLNSVGDREGCQWQSGSVSTPSGFKEAYDKFVEGGWTGLPHREIYGGQGLPVSLNAIVNEMLASANHAWMMYASLSGGAIITIDAHGSEEQKNRFLPKLVSGEWSGTMCLTEAHCGSDLGLLRTRAEPSPDGSYRISGSKIFISAGEHDLTDNIIHLVLARLPDAPEGVGGISLFIVPKNCVDSNGDVSHRNGVNCGSIEHKMGIHGNATCVINFDGAEGFLLGEPQKGMATMFTFINESRLGVAIQGQAHMQASFQKALDYAKERVQMRAPVRAFPDQSADPIISHPDIRRMLLTQKAFAEGGRLLNYYCAQLADISHCESADKERAETLLALLTPIAKGFLTEMSLEVTQNGVQILGGHGFISEWGLEQDYRDTRITAIYEGTNTIQGLDLLGRKILGSGGAILKPFIAEIDEFCDANIGGACGMWVKAVADSKALWLDVTRELGERAMTDPNSIGAAAYDYLMLSGYCTLAYFWAKAAVAANGLAEGNFRDSKLATARFYFERLLPRTQSLVTTIFSSSNNLMDLSVEAFAGE